MNLNGSSSSNSHSHLGGLRLNESSDVQQPARKKQRKAEKEELSFLGTAAANSLFGYSVRYMPSAVVMKLNAAKVIKNVATRVFGSKDLFTIIKNFVVPPSSSTRPTDPTHPVFVNSMHAAWTAKKTKRAKSQQEEFEKPWLEGDFANQSPYHRFRKWLAIPVSIPEYNDLRALGTTCKTCYLKLHEVVEMDKLGTVVLKSKCYAIVKDKSKPTLQNIDSAFTEALDAGDAEVVSSILEFAPHNIAAKLVSIYWDSLSNFGSAGSSKKERYQKVCEVIFNHLKKLGFEVNFSLSNFSSLANEGFLLFTKQMTAEGNPEAQKIVHELILNSPFGNICYVEFLQLLKERSPNTFKALLEKGAASIKNLRYSSSRHHDFERHRENDLGFKFLFDHGWSLEGQQDALSELCIRKAVVTLTAMVKQNPKLLNFRNLLHYAFICKEHRKETFKYILGVLKENGLKFHDENVTLHTIFELLVGRSFREKTHPKSLAEDIYAFMESLLQMGVSPSAPNADGQQVLHTLFPQYIMSNNPIFESETLGEFAILLARYGGNVNTRNSQNVPWVVGALRNHLDKAVLQLFQEGYFEKNLYNWTIGHVMFNFDMKEALASIGNDNAFFGYKPYLHEAVEAVGHLFRWNQYEKQNALQFIQALLEAGLNPYVKCRRVPESGRFEASPQGVTAKTLVPEPIALTSTTRQFRESLLSLLGGEEFLEENEPAPMNDAPAEQNAVVPMNDAPAEQNEAVPMNDAQDNFNIDMPLQVLAQDSDPLEDLMKL